MVKVRFNGREVEIPAGVEELSPEQYEYFCLLSWRMTASERPIDEFRRVWMVYLLGLRRVRFSLLRGEVIDELESQLDALDGFFNETDGCVSPAFTTTRNVLPEYGGYVGPGDWLEGMKFGDFVDCLNLLEATAAADEGAVIEIYSKIARILYNIPQEDEVPNLLLFHAPAFFASVWRSIMSAPVEINGKRIDFRIIFRSSEPSGRDDGTGWAGISFEVAKAGLFGTVKELEQVDFWSVLLYLYRCKFEYIEEKRKQPKK